MDKWIREHLKKCIRAERAFKKLTPVEEGLYFQVQYPDRIDPKALNRHLKNEGYVEYPIWENTKEKIKTTDLIVENIDPFTRGLVYHVAKEGGFKTLTEALDHIMYEYYEKKVTSDDK